MSKMEEIQTKLKSIENELQQLFVEREEPIHGLTLALISATNILFLGSPGTAKSLLVKEYAKRVTNAEYFEWLLTRYSTPDEIFGPISATGLMKDSYYRLTDGKLPKAHFGFLDEIYKSNSGLLNCLLPVMNERIFYDAGKPVKIPLICLVGASNEVPEEDDHLDALHDRFHLKYEIKPIMDMTGFLNMLKQDFSKPPETTISIEEIHLAQRYLNDTTLTNGMFDMFQKIRKTLSDDGISVTDRTYKISLRIAKAEAWLRGSSQVEEGDLEILKHLFWQDPDKIRKVQLAILNLTNPEMNKIKELHAQCVTMVQDVLKLPAGNDQRAQGLDAIQKARTSRAEIQTLRNSLQAKNKSTEDANKIILDINNLIKKVTNDAIGINLEMDELK